MQLFVNTAKGQQNGARVPGHCDKNGVPAVEQAEDKERY